KTRVQRPNPYILAPSAPGNLELGFNPNNPLIIRLVIKKGVPFTSATGTFKLDAIDRTLILVASLTGSTPDTQSSSGLGGPKANGGNPTYEFYRIIPGVAGNPDTLGLGQTLSSYNAGLPDNASISAGPNSFGDTSHGWSAPGALGSISCSGSSGVAC